MILRLLGLIALTFHLSAQAARLEGLEQKIDQFILQHQPVAETGVAVAVVENNQIVFFKGYGFRDRAQRLPVTQQTMFRIASNTKPFVSTTLNILSEKGMINLEAPVQSYLPGFRLENQSVAKLTTTVDMLSHRVGLPRHDLLWYLTPFSRDELFRKLRYLEMNKTPGHGFRETCQYNNLMYMTAGILLETVTGASSWQDVVRGQILQPLQMRSTHFSVEALKASPDYAVPYKGGEVAAFNEYAPVGAAGVMVSNVDDLKQWVSFYLNKGVTPSGQRLMNESTREKMWRSYSSSKEVIFFDYGLGWFLNHIGTRRMIWHGGNIDGYSSHVGMLPDDGLGLIVLINQDSAIKLEVGFELPNEQRENFKPLPVVIYEHLLGVDSPSPSPENAIRPPTDFVWSDLQSMPTARHLSEISRTPGPMSDRFMEDVLNYSELGHFQEIAYGHMGLYKEPSGQLHLLYYANDFRLQATPIANVYVVLGAKGDLDPKFTATLKMAGDQVVSIEIPMEQSVAPIRFVR